jgi:hypothetical protein
MKLAHTIILFFIAGLILAYIILVEREHPTTVGKGIRSASLAVFRPDNINVVEMENAGAETRITFRDGRWKVREPFEDYADPKAVKELIAGLATIEVIRKDRIDDGKERDRVYKELGLDTDKQSVVLKGDGPPIEIYFGIETPSGEGVYARQKPSSELAQIKKEARDRVLRKPDDFRDHHLARFEPKEIVEIRARRPDGDLELELKEGFWLFRKPLQAQADNQVVFDTLSKLTTTEIEKFVANTQETAADYGLSDPQGVIHLKSAKGADFVIKLGNLTPDKKSVYASVKERPGIFQVPEALRAFVALPPDQWQERRILRLPEEALREIDVQVAGHAETHLKRGSIGWLLDLDGKVNHAQQSHVADLYRWLSQARVEEFAGNVKGKRAEFGLDQPQLRVRFKALSPKKLRELQSGLQVAPPEMREKDWPEEAELLVGREEKGQVYIQTPFQGSVVTIPVGPLAEVPADPYKWRSLLLNAYVEDNFSWITYQPANEPTQRFDRGPGAEWRPAKGAREGVSQFVRESVSTLGRLRAVEYVDSAEGMEMPLMAIEYRLEGYDTVYRLEVGAPAGDRGYFARLRGLETPFILSRPDYEVLTLPLTAGGTAAK